MMHGKTVVITGATSGIGQVTAEELARMGACIVQIARDRERGNTALMRLQQINPDARHSVHYADLSRISQTKRIAAAISTAEPHIDVLINNAGAVFSSRHVTEDGLECTFALNHVSYFVLTQTLRETLINSAPARIINTASDAHQAAVLDFDDLQSERAYRPNLFKTLRYGGPGFEVYARSKLCNILFTRELAKRLKDSGVAANCAHPGFVATRFGDAAGGLLGFGVRMAKRFAIKPEEGARMLVYLATSPEVEGRSGEYFENNRAVPPSQAAQDDATAQRLWAETARLTGLPA